jgi:hypothetical protein
MSHYILFALFEAVAFAFDVDDGAVMQHPVKDSGGGGHVGKELVPPGKGFVRGENR